MLLVHATRMVNMRVDFAHVVEVTITNMSAKFGVLSELAHTDEARSDYY